MKNLGEKTRAGARMMATGVVFLVLSVLLLTMNLTVGRGTPSALFWLLLLSGAILASVGFARRILGSR